MSRAQHLRFVSKVPCEGYATKAYPREGRRVALSGACDVAPNEVSGANQDLPQLIQMVLAAMFTSEEPDQQSSIHCLRSKFRN